MGNIVTVLRERLVKILRRQIDVLFELVESL